MNKRKYQNVFFLNHAKEEEKDAQPPSAKKQRKFTRTDLSGKDKHMIITWMQECYQCVLAGRSPKIFFNITLRCNQY